MANNSQVITRDQAIVEGVETHVDGFTMGASLRFLPQRFYPAAVANLYDLRTAINHRPKDYVIPRDSQFAIPTMQTQTEQVKMVGHTVIWGYGFAVIDGEGEPVISDFFVELLDPVHAYKLFQYPVQATMFRAGSVGPAANLFPVLLAEPYVVNSQGVMSVSITNRGAADAVCQLVLRCAEPCAVRG